jgi:lysozyme
MKRIDFFDKHRALYADGRIPPEHVAILDAIADELGLARIEPAPTGLKPSCVAIDNIKRFEGCKLTAYPDPGTGGDPWTIGWGSTGEGIKKGVTWTQEQADARLEADVNRFAEGVARLVEGSATTQGQFDACVSLAYNIGLDAFAKSTLLKKHRAGDLAGAAEQFLRWTHAGGRVLKGLERRREAERSLYLGLGK